jgi:hypothetical protein
LRKSCALAVVCSFLLVLCKASAQDASPQKPRRIGLGLTMSSLGAGIELSARLTRRSNVRAGFNAFAFDHDFTKDKVAYTGHLNLRSLQASYDWFPFGGAFHLSPGLLVYNGNRVRANASMPLGQAGGDFAGPITGNGIVEFAKVAPMFLLGWGNLVPRSRKRFSFPFEFGVIYTGTPRAALRLSTVLCDASGANCIDAASDPMVQSSIQAEQVSLNHSVAPFKFYPVISTGIGYTF